MYFSFNRLEDGSVTKTDEDGFYQFPRVEVGGHLISLDLRRIPADHKQYERECSRCMTTSPCKQGK